MLLRKRVPEDLPAVRTLLSQARLPHDGLETTEGWVIESPKGIQGHVALECTEDAVVLRSLVVSPLARGQGLGAQLMACAETSVLGRVLVLRTETIGPWMLRRGYVPTTLAEVPESVRRTSQFSGTLCAGTPVFRK